MQVNLKDGLYQVTTKYLCAGFVVEKGQIESCAPILKGKLSYWIRVAQKVDIELTPPTS